MSDKGVCGMYANSCYISVKKCTLEQNDWRKNSEVIKSTTHSYPASHCHKVNNKRQIYRKSARNDINGPK